MCRNLFEDTYITWTWNVFNALDAHTDPDPDPDPNPYVDAESYAYVITHEPQLSSIHVYISKPETHFYDDSMYTKSTDIESTPLVVD